MAGFCSIAIYENQLLLQIDSAENDEELRVTFGIDEAADLLLSSGFRKPLSELCMSDKLCVKSVLIDYHCLIKVRNFFPCPFSYHFPMVSLSNYLAKQVKAEMDHFIERLRVLGVLDMVKKHPLLFSPLFTDDNPTPLTAGTVSV